MMDTEYSSEQPTRADVDALRGATVLDFGTNWCGYCQAAQSIIASALATHENVRHLKVEDGPGRPLGRSFRVKLWPTLIFLRDGHEVARLVRPNDASMIVDALEQIEGASA
jgi:thioredoxin 1